MAVFPVSDLLLCGLLDFVSMQHLFLTFQVSLKSVYFCLRAVCLLSNVYVMFF